MPHCQELKNQLAETERNLSEMRSRLGEYKDSGNSDILEKLEQKNGDIGERTTAIKESLQRALDELISEHPQAEVFKDKLIIQDGRVISKQDLNFMGLSEVYIPSVINVVEGELDLGNLNSAEGLELPQVVKGDLDLRSITSAEDLELPVRVAGNLYLDSLNSAEDLKFPQIVEGYLDLQNLTSAEDLELPQIVAGFIDLRDLSSAEGLELPDKIGGDFDLSNLESAKNLDLSNINVGGVIYLGNLSAEERGDLKEEYPRLADKITTLT